MPTRTLTVRRLGVVPYADAWELQKALHQERVEGKIGDQLLLLSHPHVLTVGSRAGKPNPWENLQADRAVLEALGVQLVEADRGGDITWHGPGQLVGYPIVGLDDYGRDVKRYVNNLEAANSLALRAFGIASGRREGFPGVWIGDNKITAIGARIRKWVTMHGFALNMRGPLEGFGWIVPCGLEGKGVTSVERQLGVALDDEVVVDAVVDAFAAVFDLEPVR